MGTGTGKHPATCTATQVTQTKRRYRPMKSRVLQGGRRFAASARRAPTRPRDGSFSTTVRFWTLCAPAPAGEAEQTGDHEQVRAGLGGHRDAKADECVALGRVRGVT